MKSFNDLLEEARDVKEVFEIVRDAVRLTLNESRAGIDLGIAELGNGPRELLSAFYPVESNIIVLNKTPIKRMLGTRPELMKPYVFTVLLHEYLHSLGYLNENDARKLTYAITNYLLGEDHVATQMAHDMRRFFPYLLYPGGHPARNGMGVIQLDNIDYIG